MAKITPAYGWLPDRPDHRDVYFTATREQLAAVPSQVDLRDQFTFPVYDQGKLGSCTANAIAAAIQFEQVKQEMSNPFTPSRLFIYYNERDLENTVDSDSGAQIRDGLRSVAELGAPPEAQWPYNIGQFTQKPPADVYAVAANRKVLLYRRVDQQMADMKTVLSLGFPFVFGFTVYESFESRTVANTGRVPMPGMTESVVGGHAVLAVGYQDKDQSIIFRNSWSDGWGDAGYGYIPYSYLQNSDLSTDFWTIELVQ